VQATDPGRALVTGEWNAIGRFDGTTLRALAPRAPYFHNGSANDLIEAPLSTTTALASGQPTRNPTTSSPS